MSAQPLRFLHASDLHLEQPPYGLSEAPDPLRSVLLNAAWRAAEQLFDVACNEEVDFVLLAGDVMDIAKAGPRGIVFLYEQFQRLAAKKIHTYWVGGRCDALDAWPEAIALPPEVHLFPTGRIEQVTHYRGEVPVATIAGFSRTGKGPVPVGRFPSDPTGLYSIGLAHGPLETDSLAGQRVAYLALGGSHVRKNLSPEPRAANYAGTHQGRSPRETGPHGVTLVQVSSGERAHTRLIPTDSLRWLDERVEVSADVTRLGLEHLLSERLQAMVDRNAGRDLLISWTLTATSGWPEVLRPRQLAEELLLRLRREATAHGPLVWSHAVHVESPDSTPFHWKQEETILGDFLRLSEQFMDDPELEIDLPAYLTTEQAEGEIGSLAEIDGKRERRNVLKQATWLGAELLGAEQDSLRPN